MKLDILGLQAFLSIAQHGSFQRAAASLNISQTALSHRIRKFEESVGVKLVLRTTRKVELTRAGMDLFPKARHALEECTACIRDIRALGMQRTESVSFGCLPTLAIQLLPKSLQQFSAVSPSVNLRIVDRSAPQLTEMVLARTIEFAVTFISAVGPDLETDSIRKSRFVAVCPRLHPLAKKRSIEPGDLAGIPLIRLGQGDIAHVMLEDALSTKHGALRWTFEVQQAAMAIRMVGSGLGVALLPSFSVDSDRDRDVSAVPLDHPAASLTLGILSLKHPNYSPQTEALIQHLRRAVKGYSGWVI